MLTVQRVWRRRRELVFRLTNRVLLSALRRLYRWYSLKGVFEVGGATVCYCVEGVRLEYYAAEFGCTGNADSRSLGEEATRDLLFSVMPTKSVFYDIGAHEGVYTLTALVRRPDVTVHSFEPLAERLKRNLLLNGGDVSRVHAGAVGEAPGTIRMIVERRSNSHASPDGDCGIQVPLYQLDRYVLEKCLEPPDFIKIDVEGMEFAALRGAIGLLREHRPVIVCEINRCYERYGENVGAFLVLMSEIGYDMFRHWAGKLHRVDIRREMTLSQLGRSAFSNYWFVPRGVGPAALQAFVS